MTEDFNKWWNSDKLMDGNPYKKDSPAYWAWEGWVAGAASRDAEIAQLRAELVKALAACKMKDETLQELDQLIPVGATIAALAVQPDDAALKAWLGEPVATAMINQHGTRWMHWKADLAHGKNLYSPKGLK